MTVPRQLGALGLIGPVLRYSANSYSYLQRLVSYTSAIAYLDTLYYITYNKYYKIEKRYYLRYVYLEYSELDIVIVCLLVDDAIRVFYQAIRRF